MSSSNRWAAEAASTTSTERLVELSSHRDKAVRAAVARNPATPTELLETLVDDKHHLVRFGIAENPDARAWRVALQARDADVRVILAQRQDLDEATFQSLVSDPSRDVRVSVCENTRRQDVLGALARDEDHHVRASTALNGAISDQDLELLAADRIARVRAVAAQSRRLSPETVTRLAGDRSANVRYFLLEQHHDRADLAAMLKDDVDSETASLARRRLSRSHGRA